MILLQDILFNYDKEILDYMILRFVINRNYYERCTLGSWSDEEDEREKKILSNENNINTSRTLAPSSIDRIINRHVFDRVLRCILKHYQSMLVLIYSYYNI